MLAELFTSFLEYLISLISPYDRSNLLLFSMMLVTIYQHLANLQDAPFGFQVAFLFNIDTFDLQETTSTPSEYSYSICCWFLLFFSFFTHDYLKKVVLLNYA